MDPPIGVALATVGMNEIGVYIFRRQNMVAQYIATRPIMDLCLTAERKPVLRPLRQCWYQNDLNILGIRAGRAAVEVRVETGMEE